MLTHNEQIIFSVILGLCITIGIITCIVVLWVAYLDKEFRKNIPNLFLFNLLTIDMGNLLLVMPFSISSIDGVWHLGEGWKNINAFLGTTFELASVLTWALISLDRFIAVMKPFAYRSHMTKTKATYLIIFTWCQAMIFSVIPVPLKWYIYNDSYMSCTFNYLNKTLLFHTYMVFFMVCNFLISLIIIVGVYLYIFRVGNAHRRKLSVALIPTIILNLHPNVNRACNRRQRTQAVAKIISVVGAFMVCHLPYAVMRIIELSNYSIDNVPSIFTVSAKWMSYSKNVFDPLVYFLLQKKFRQAFTKLYVSSRFSQDNGIIRSMRHSVTMIQKLDPTTKRQKYSLQETTDV